MSATPMGYIHVQIVKTKINLRILLGEPGAVEGTWGQRRL